MQKTAAILITMCVSLVVAVTVIEEPGKPAGSRESNRDIVQVVTGKSLRPPSPLATDLRYDQPTLDPQNQGRLLSAVRLQYPSLHDVTADCTSSRCTIQLSSRDLAGSREREDIYKAATGDLDGLMGRMGYTTASRDVVVNDDDTTVVTLNTSRAS